jgi:chaperone BCS1
MSYCSFEAFRFLAKNYIIVDAHPLFDDVRALLREVNFTPADVVELLTLKLGAADDDDDGVSCLAGLVKALQEAKKKASQKAMAETGGGACCGDDEESVEPANQD